MEKQIVRLLRQNQAIVRTRIGKLGRESQAALSSLTHDYRFALALGDMLLLDGKWYVTHTGLIRLATRRKCLGIRVEPVPQFCDPSLNRWVFKATVHKSSGSKGFVGYGDADPSNVSPLVRGAEMRVAETRAVNRALRKAYGIGLCSVEELGWPSIAPSHSDNHARPSNPSTSNVQTMVTRGSATNSAC